MAKSTTTVRMKAGWERNLDEGMARPVLDRLGKAIVDDAKRYVPVDTGALQDTIRHEIVPAPGDFGVELHVIAGDDNRGVDYPAYVENGTSRMAAQPFLRPAVEQRRRL